MSVFYSQLIQSNQILLDAEEAHHCVKVLRKKIGDLIEVIDGEGGFYIGKIASFDKHNVVLSIVEKKNNVPSKPTFHLCFAPTKSNDRTEWLLEKACEMGVAEITLLVCEHSERIKINEERLKKIVLSACKQSKNAWLPKLNGLKKFEQFIQEENSAQKKLIAYCGEEEKVEINELNAESICVLIGPEGDFSNQEIQLAKKYQYKVLSLGENRMRVETAGLFAIAVAKANLYRG